MSVKWWEESKLYAIRKDKRIRAGQEGLSIRDKDQEREIVHSVVQSLCSARLKRHNS
jgi:hypothetical protein